MLNSTGSFKRFDSIDRDYKPIDQTSLITTSWNVGGANIPPQPLRPAPAPTDLKPVLKDSVRPIESLVKQRRYTILMEIFIVNKTF